jgi:hypothetical protein
MSVLQQSVTLRVTPNIIRGGSYPAGYQIINTSLQATIWVSPNAGMSSGQGTPVYPGTSLVWNTDNNLFLILGNDAQSVAAGFADIILSYDTQNWQPNPIAIATAVINSGVLIVDSPVEIITNNIYSTAGVATVYDVSRYSSLQMYVNPSAGTTLTFEFSGDSLFLNPIRRYPIVGGSGAWRATFPVEGKYFRIVGSGIANYGCQCFASYRQVTGLKQSVPTTNLIVAASLSVPATNFTRISTPPWWGEVEFHCVNAVAGTWYNVLISSVLGQQTSYPNGGANDNGGSWVNGGGGFYNQRRFAMNGHDVQVDMVNPTGAAVQMSFVIIPLNNY